MNTPISFNKAHTKCEIRIQICVQLCTKQHFQCHGRLRQLITHRLFCQLSISKTMSAFDVTSPLVKSYTGDFELNQCLK